MQFVNDNNNDPARSKSIIIFTLGGARPVFFLFFFASHLPHPVTARFILFHAYVGQGEKHYRQDVLYIHVEYIRTYITCNTLIC